MVDPMVENIPPLRYIDYEVKYMFKAYLKSRNISMYKLSKSSGVPYSTLNDLVNKKLPVINLKSGQLYSLSKSLVITMDELYSMCMQTCIVYSDKFDEEAAVVVRHKSYYLLFDKNGNTYEEEIIPVKSESTRYIDILAKWKFDELLSRLAMEDVYETIYSKTKR